MILSSNKSVNNVVFKFLKKNHIITVNVNSDDHICYDSGQNVFFNQRIAEFKRQCGFDMSLTPDFVFSRKESIFQPHILEVLSSRYGRPVLIKHSEETFDTRVYELFVNLS